MFAASKTTFKTIMKKQNLKTIGLIALTSGILFSGCTLLKDLEYKVDKNPLEMHGDSVTVVINGKFVEKGLHKKAIVEVTPTLYASDGTKKAFETKVFQGEKAAGNGEVVGKGGKSFTYRSTIPYSPELEVADLKVELLPKKGTKEKALVVTEKIADATIITPLLVQKDARVIIGADQFKRTTEEQFKAVIHYDKNKSVVRSSELKDADIKALEEFLKNSIGNQRVALKSTNILAYASPEGELQLNTNLATERAESAAQYLLGAMKKLKMEQGNDFITRTPKGEDWEGFKTEVEKTTHPDKDIILRVLQMTADVQKREQDIRAMAKTFEFLEKSVLPQLRRSQLVVIYDKVGYSDEELTQLSKTSPDSLKLEELLYAATLTEDLNEKLRIYQVAERVYPNDWRAPNNVGYVLMLQNKMSEAEAEFKKANGIKENSISINNLAVVEHMKGNRDKALEMFESSKGAGSDVSYNIGVINIQKGDYSAAVSNMADAKTFNKALATLLNGDADAALRIVDESADKDSAIGYYLKAICGARSNNKDVVTNNLKSAVSKDPSLKEKAQKDREFLKFADVVSGL